MIIMRRNIATLLLCWLCITMQAFTSPNGKFRLTTDETGLTIAALQDEEWRCVLQINEVVTSVNDAGVQQVDYHMLTGKRSHCTNAYRELKLSRADGSDWTLRLYNDGVTWKSGAKTTINLSTSTHNWLQRWTDSYEEFFPKDRTTQTDQRWAYPALFEYENGTFLLLTESNLDADCAAASLYSTERQGIYQIRQDGEGKSGWQTAIIGTLADVVESTLVTDNSAPCRLPDTSWIQPGVASWVYWAYNHGSKEYDIVKKYIDMAVKLKLPYVLIDAEWDEMQGEKTIEDLLRYAVDCGVKPMIWYNSSVGWINGAPGPKFRLNKPEDREREFAWCRDNGIVGVKIDFFSGDTNLNIRYMVELLECAARYNLQVNFHGATLPRGWQRTYPNLISVEGVYGAEWYNNLPILTRKAAAHNATLPFTRNVVGSMDYTPCAFSDSQHPHITSHAHELALTALFESGIQHLADRPESFLAQPQTVQDYLTHLPTAWDETRLLSGYPGESAILARRKGTTWYVAGINGTDNCKELKVDWSTLTKSKKTSLQATLFEDSGHLSDPWEISTTVKISTNTSTCFNCIPRGGFVAVVKEAD